MLVLAAPAQRSPTLGTGSCGRAMGGGDEWLSLQPYLLAA